MPKSVFTATGPNGELFKRSSENRSYTHMVAYTLSYDKYLAHATSDGWDKRDREHHRYQVKCANGAGVWPTTQDDLNFIAKHPSEDAYVVFKAEERVAIVERNLSEGFFDRYYAEGWCGRLDLAQKLAARVRAEEWKRAADVVVLETVKVK